MEKKKKKYYNNHNKEISCGGKMKKRAKKIQFTKNYNPTTTTIPNYMKKKIRLQVIEKEEKKQSKING